MTDNEISFEEWVEAMEAAKPKTRQIGWTTTEIHEVTGRPKSWIRARIREGLESGLIRPTKKSFLSMGGYGPPQTVGAWVFNVPKNHPKKTSPSRKAAKKVR